LCTRHPLRERGVRLGDADQRDAHRVVRVAVAVRVDRTVEAGDQLVAAAVDEVLAVGRRLPARDADRKHGRLGRDAVQAGWAARADEQPGELGAVVLDLRGVLWVRARRCVVALVDEVEPGQDPTAQVRVREIDAGVEQRDRHAAAVVAGQLDGGPVAARRVERARREQRLGHRRRIGGAHWVDACDLRQVLEQRDSARVERGCEAVEHARVAEVGPDGDPLRRERRQDLLLRRKRLRRP